MIFGMDSHQTKMKSLLNRKGAQVRFSPDLMIVQAVQTIQKPVEVIIVENSGVSQFISSSEAGVAGRGRLSWDGGGRRTEYFL